MSDTVSKQLSDQEHAVLCAYLDLVGAYQCAIRDGAGGADNGHDWDAHKLSIHGLETHFDFIEPEPLDYKAVYDPE